MTQAEKEKVISIISAYYSQDGNDDPIRDEYLTQIIKKIQETFETT